MRKQTKPFGWQKQMLFYFSTRTGGKAPGVIKVCYTRQRRAIEP
jgi:hypothetical protein